VVAITNSTKKRINLRLPLPVQPGLTSNGGMFMNRGGPHAKPVASSDRGGGGSVLTTGLAQDPIENGCQDENQD
jgi:hypothetical protein